MSRESEIPFMIEAFVLPGHPPLYLSIKPAVDISGDTSSAEAFAKARYWLQHCVNSHEACASNTSVRLPTRLVSITFDRRAQRSTVKLVKTNNSFGQYACLSHCWGPRGSSGLLCTTAANYEDHLNEIPMASLPRTFQHALITSRRLGLSFIWIDSLCIIQGDAADWAHEAARMGSYYSNSFVTIAASWSPCPSGGCFSLSEPEFIARKLAVPGTSSSIYLRRVLEHGRGRPLLTRGWVFQERMLSPQVLHFGLREMVWECLTSVACECGMSGALQTELSSKDEYTRAMSTTQRDRLKDVWRDMVQRYTWLNLTYASDRFAAIAGVAKQMQRFRSSRYFAGLWEDSMIGDMLWKPFSSLGSPVKLRKDENQAPTWPWASVEAPWITYDHLGTLSGTRGRSESFERIEETYVKILSISGEPLAEENSGGSELGAIIMKGSCIRGRVVHSPLHRPPSPDSSRRRPEYLEWYRQRKHELKFEIALDNSSEAKFHADYDLAFSGRYCVRSGDAIVVLRMALGEGDDVLSEPSVFGLVLRQIGCPNTYERVGLAGFQDKEGSDAFEWSEKIVLQIV